MSGSSSFVRLQDQAAASETILSNSNNNIDPSVSPDVHHSMDITAWEVNQRVHSLESVFEQTQSTLEILVDKFSGHQEKMNQMEKLISLLQRQVSEQKTLQECPRSRPSSPCLTLSLPLLSLTSFALFALYMASFSVDTWRQDLQLVRFSVRVIEGFLLLVLAGSVNDSSCFDHSRSPDSRDFSTVQLLSSICASILMIDTARMLYVMDNSSWGSQDEASDLAYLTLTKGSIDPFNIFKDTLLSISFFVLLVWKIFLYNRQVASFSWEWTFKEYPVFFGFLYFGIRLAAGILSNISSRELFELLMSIAYIFGGVFFAFLSIKLSGSSNEVEQHRRGNSTRNEVALQPVVVHSAEDTTASNSPGERVERREEENGEEGSRLLPVVVTREKEMPTHFSSRNSESGKEQKQTSASSSASQLGEVEVKFFNGKLGYRTSATILPSTTLLEVGWDDPALHLRCVGRSRSARGLACLLPRVDPPHLVLADPPPHGREPLHRPAGTACQGSSRSSGTAPRSHLLAEVRARTPENAPVADSHGSLEESVLVLEPQRHEAPPNFQPAPEEPPQQSLHPGAGDEPFLFDSLRASSVGTIFESAAQSTVGGGGGGDPAAQDKYFTSSSTPNGYLLRELAGAGPTEVMQQEAMVETPVKYADVPAAHIPTVACL
eukprot:10129-Hanusia_phi.AAC.1